MTEPAFTVPLNRLAVWSGNVRKMPSSQDALAELAASIGSVGVINPLTVFKRGNAFQVVAGSRRHAALLALCRQGRVPEDFLVPCTLITKALAAEVSLAENAIREDMHPADEFVAFLRLSKEGLSNEDIAAKFGCTPGTVARRLKLARVCPSILSAYREGTIGLEAVMAYAVTDNTRRQKKVFASLAGYRANDADTIRSALTDGEVDASDRRVAFVGLQSYLGAGGTTRRDLFAADDDPSGTYLLDPALLDGLVNEKLAALEASVLAEGWSWAESRVAFDYSERSTFRHVRPALTDLPEELATEHSALDAERDALQERHDVLTEEQEERLSWIDARMDEIEATRREIWTDDVLALAGCIVSIGYDGDPEIHRGLLTSQDAKRLGTQGRADSSSKAAPIPSDSLSQRLTEQLTKHRTAALGAELSAKPEVALAAVVFTLAGAVLFERPRTTAAFSSRSGRAVQPTPWTALPRRRLRLAGSRGWSAFPPIPVRSGSGASSRTRLPFSSYSRSWLDCP